MKWLRKEGITLLSNLMREYFKVTKDLDILHNENTFIMYRVVNRDLEIWDIYSNKKGQIVDMANHLVDITPDVDRVIGFVDNNYKGKNRSHIILSEWGMTPFKKTEEYTHYEKLLC